MVRLGKKGYVCRLLMERVKTNLTSLVRLEIVQFYLSFYLAP
jgi:hypothetical protein